MVVGKMVIVQNIGIYLGLMCRKWRFYLSVCEFIANFVRWQCAESDQGKLLIEYVIARYVPM